MLATVRGFRNPRAPNFKVALLTCVDKASKKNSHLCSSRVQQASSIERRGAGGDWKWHDIHNVGWLFFWRTWYLMIILILGPTELLVAALFRGFTIRKLPWRRPAQFHSPWYLHRHKSRSLYHLRSISYENTMDCSWMFRFSIFFLYWIVHPKLAGKSKDSALSTSFVPWCL